MLAMTRTARRRWTRELESEVDGIAIGESGPILVHGYDPPAGGKWVDSVIPGKLGALDRTTGETLWFSPCEVGYGRGFGAGLGGQDDVIVMGPSNQGHRIVRMSLGSGELLEVREIEPFDEALVAEDFCVSVTPNKISCLATGSLEPIWSYGKKGQRFHRIGRDGKRLFVVTTMATTGRTGKQGVLMLDVSTGRPMGWLLDSSQTAVRCMAVGSDCVTLVVSDLMAALPQESVLEYLTSNTENDLDDHGRLHLLCLPSDGTKSAKPLWFEELLEPSSDEFPDILVSHNSGKLYIVQGASLDVRDLVSGGKLGEMTVPGLDEHVAWSVSQGAGVLAEETRISIFEIPD